MVKFITEEWKRVIYKNHVYNYEASSLGRIRNFKTKRVLSQHLCAENYFHTGLCIEGKSKTFSVHKLIITAFKPNPLNLKQVNHIDLNRQNNCINNLEWSTPSDNIKHSIMNNKNRKSIKKAIHQFDGPDKKNKKTRIFERCKHVYRYQARINIYKKLCVKISTSCIWIYMALY